MDSENFKEYLEKRYYDQLNYFEKSAGLNQRKYKYFQWVLIVLSALTPILAAIEWDKIVVIIVSAIVAILTTGLKTFNYQELWTNYRTTCEQLKPEIHYYNFHVGPYAAADVDKESLFITRVEAMLDKERQIWPPVKNSGDAMEKGEVAKQPSNPK
ncbi:hypothetical protein MASR2M47_26930 [Draconibacterium sp.]